MNNTTKKSAYQLLLEKLDDQNFAQTFFDEKLAEAKQSIEQILSVMSGWDVITESGNEWGHEALYKVFELFLIKHTNFSHSDLAEELQHYIYECSLSHGTAFYNWSKDWQLERTLDFGEKEQTAEPHETEPQADLADERERFYNQIWANKLSYVLASPDVSDDVKNAVTAVLDVIGNETGTGFYDQPEVLKVGFPLQMEKLSSPLRRAYILSIDSLFQSMLEPEVLAEIEKMNVRFEEKSPLDLSEMSADSLNTDDRKSENRRAAECLSEILNSAEMPNTLINGIRDGLHDLLQHEVNDESGVLQIQHSPEYIEAILNGAKQ